MDDISQIFALEVKQDLANRYFGFRKQIEDDTNRYLERLGAVGKENIKLIIQDLLAIRTLLGKEALFDEFLDLLQYPKVLIARLIRDYGEAAGTAAANGKKMAVSDLQSAGVFATGSLLPTRHCPNMLPHSTSFFLIFMKNTTRYAIKFKNSTDKMI